MKKLKVRNNANKILRRLRLRTLIALVLIAILAPIIIIAAFNPGESKADWWNDAWGYRKKITIDPTKVSGTADLTDFPVLVSVTGDTDMQDVVQSDGDDLVFTDINGNILPHELEYFYNEGLGTEFVAWVKVPTLYTDVETVIYLYYGNPDSHQMSNPNEVWSDDYRLVQHMEETTSGNSDFTDSTSNGNNSNYVNLDASGSTPDTAGKIGSGIYINGDNDHINIPNDNSLLPESNLTIQAWVDPDALTRDYSIAIKGTSTSPWNAIQFSYASGGAMDFMWRNNSGTAFYARSSSGELTTTGWYHVAVVKDGSTLYVYVNGVDVTSWRSGTPSGTIYTSSADALVISHSVTSYSLDGKLDELRMSSSAKSSDWLLTEYNNQNDPSSFYSIDNQERSTETFGWWRFDEGEGATAHDSISGFDATMGVGSSSPVWISEDLCVQGKCLYLDGNDYLSSGTTDELNITSEITISAWIRTADSSSGQKSIVSRMQSETPYNGYELGLNGSVPYFHTGGTYASNALDGTTNISDGKWHHLMGVYNGTTAYLYLDGQLENSGTKTNNLDISGENFDLGTNYNRANFINGFIDEVKIYAEAKSADYAKSEYNKYATLIGSGYQDNLSDGLIGYWQLDESSGNASDTSGSSLTLTNNASTSFAMGKFGNGSEHIPTSSQYFSTASSINGVRSVSFWVNPDSDTNYYLSLTSGAYITSSGGTLSATGFSNPEIYVNGALTSSISADQWSLITITSDTAIDANQFYLGRQDTNYFDGTLDEVRLYNRKLSQADIIQLYNWAPGPIGHWKMDENVSGNGQSIYDSSTNELNGTTDDGANNTGMNCNLPGKIGGSCSLDGDDFISISDASGVLEAPYDLTYQGWFKSSYSGAVQSIITQGTTNDWTYAMYLNSSNKLECRLYQGGTTSSYLQVASIDSVNDGQWHHGGCVVEGNTVYIYVDGNLQAESSSTSGTRNTSTAGSTYFGKVDYSGGTSPYTGELDDIRIYNYARSTEQIRHDIQSSLGGGIGNPLPEPTAHWKMDDMQGTSAQDASGNNFDLTFVNTPTWKQDGKISGAVNFNSSSSEYGYAADNSDLSITGDLSISAWINPSSNTSSTYYDIAGKWDGTNESYLLTQYGDEIRFFIDSSSNYETTVSANIQTGSWYHVLGVYDANNQTAKIYVNGTLTPSTTAGTIPNSIGDDAGRFHIAAEDSSTSATNFYNGIIDDVKIYNSALSANQVGADMITRSTLGVSTLADEDDYISGGAGNPPAAEWKMDENQGTSIYDTSENEYTGTLGTGSSAPSWESDCKQGACLSFDGNDYVDIGASSASIKAITAWVYPNTTTEYLLDLNGTDYIWINGGTLTAQGFSSPTYYVNGIQTTSPTIPANTWTHIAVTTDTAENGSDLDIGRIEGTGLLEGKIDHVKLYNYARTPGQIAYDYNRGKPVGHWKLDECEGETAHDSSGFGNDADITVTTTGGNTNGIGACTVSTSAWGSGAEGKYGSSLYFDGTGDFADAGNENSLYPTSTMTISAWIKTATTQQNSAIAGAWYSAASQANSYLLYLGQDLVNDKVGFGIYETDNNAVVLKPNSDQASISSNTWHHVVGVADGSVLRIYLDGKDLGETLAYDGTIKSSGSSNFIIGKLSNNGYDFEGQIDDVKLFNYALSANQVKILYNAGAAVRFE